MILVFSKTRQIVLPGQTEKYGKRVTHAELIPYPSSHFSEEASSAYRVGAGTGSGGTRYLGDGRLVLLGAEEGKIFQRHEGKWVPYGCFAAPPEAASAIALTGTNQAHEFSLFQSTGAIQRWTVPT